MPDFSSNDEDQILKGFTVRDPFIQRASLYFALSEKRIDLIDKIKELALSTKNEEIAELAVQIYLHLSEFPPDLEFEKKIETNLEQGFSFYDFSEENWKYLEKNASFKIIQKVLNFSSRDFPPSSFNFLKSAFQSPDPRIRSLVCQRSKDITDADIFHYLLVSVNDPDERVSQDAFDSVKRMPDRVIQKNLVLIAEGNNLAAKRTLATCLPFLLKSSLEPAFEKISNSSDKAISEKAQELLNEIKSQSSTEKALGAVNAKMIPPKLLLSKKSPEKIDTFELPEEEKPVFEKAQEAKVLPKPTGLAFKNAAQKPFSSTPNLNNSFLNLSSEKKTPQIPENTEDLTQLLPLFRDEFEEKNLVFAKSGESEKTESEKIESENLNFKSISKDRESQNFDSQLKESVSSVQSGKKPIVPLLEITSIDSILNLFPSFIVRPLSKFISAETMEEKVSALRSTMEAVVSFLNFSFLQTYVFFVPKTKSNDDAVREILDSHLRGPASVRILHQFALAVKDVKGIDRFFTAPMAKLLSIPSEENPLFAIRDLYHLTSDENQKKVEAISPDFNKILEKMLVSCKPILENKIVLRLPPGVREPFLDLSGPKCKPLSFAARPDIMIPMKQPCILASDRSAFLNLFPYFEYDGSGLNYKTPNSESFATLLESIQINSKT
ncbi:MAG: hypothetical protein HQM08_04260 [Candidatus Riflebacteria bacterium]|nr:hypothetical protein [Candidatus Riflebacteria bacterium]